MRFVLEGRSAAGTRPLVVPLFSGHYLSHPLFVLREPSEPELDSVITVNVASADAIQRVFCGII